MIAPKGRLTYSLALYSIMGISINFPDGYTNSYPNTAVESFENFINASFTERGIHLSNTAFTLVWSATLNVWFVGYLIGTFLTPLFTEKFGRKIALIVATAISLVGAVFNLCSIIFDIPELFFLGRSVGSIGSGISFGGLILFLQEVSPTQYRGMSSSTCETTFLLNTVLGIFCGMNIAFGDKLLYLTGLSIIPGLIGILVLLPLKETPKYLLLRKGDLKAARESILFYRGNVNVNDVISDIEKEKYDVEEKSSNSAVQKVLFVFRNARLRKAFIIGMMSMQLIASFWPITYLSTAILQNIFIPNTAQYVSLLFIVSNFIAALVGLSITERFGRRPLILFLGLVNTFSLILFIICDKLSHFMEPFKYGTIVALVLFGVSYGIGLGPIAFFITSELVLQQHRSLVQSIVYALNATINFLISLATLPVYEIIGSYCFLPLFIIPNVFSLAYLFYVLPETKDKEIHEVVEKLIESGNRVLPSALTENEKIITNKDSL